LLLVLAVVGIALWRKPQTHPSESNVMPGPIRRTVPGEGGKEGVAPAAEVETARLGTTSIGANVTWSLGPVQELELSPTQSGKISFASLVRGESFSPPADIAPLTQRLYWWEPLLSPVDQWLRSNDIDLFCIDEFAGGLELIHHYYGFAAGVILSSNICAGLDEMEGSRVRRYIEEFVDDALVYQVRGRPKNRMFSLSVPYRNVGQEQRAHYYCFFRTGFGRYGVLQARESSASRGSVHVRYRLFQAHTNGPSPSVDPIEVRPDLRFIAWQDQWRKDGPPAARRPDGALLTQELDRKHLAALHPGGIDFTAPADSEEKPRFLHLWFSHPLFDALSLTEVVLSHPDNRPIIPGAAGSIAWSHQAASPPNGNTGWLIYTMSPGIAGHLPDRVNVRLRYTFGPPGLPRKIPIDFSGGMALEDGGQLNGVGQDSSSRAFVAVAGLRRDTQARQFFARALTKDGERLACSGKSISGGTRDDSVMTERLLFDSPLNDIAYFMLGTRDVETMEWTDVALPPQ
jgi:hypothetical protein